MKKNKFIILLILCFSLLLLVNPANAEQTIINAPSSDVLPLGNIILKDSNDFEPATNNAKINPSMTFGIGHGMEVSAGIPVSIKNSTSVKGEFAAKKVFFIGPATRFTVGGRINPYFGENKAPDSYIYTHVSQRIKKTRTSLTIGGYVYGAQRLPNDAGFLVGIDQVIIPNKLRFACDWLSTQDSFGKMGIGLKYRPIPTLSVTGAVIIPNQQRDIIAFKLSLSKYLSIDDLKKRKKQDVKTPEI